MSIGMILDKLLEMLPMPDNPFELTWFGIGMLLAVSFSRTNNQGLDEALQGTKTFQEKFGKALQYFLGRMLHFVHHWWIGMLFVIYCGTTAYYNGMPMIPFPELYWLGFGMLFEDALYHTAASFRNGLLGRITNYISRINGNNNQKSDK